MSKYEATIGLEIHAELKTATKMFCACKNETFVVDDKRLALSNKPNTNICPVCTGMPGTLPILNKQAIEMTIKTGLALNCQIAKFTKWDRKNYFYPDLPKGYQISQYDLPIASRGWLKLKTENEKLKTIGITRIHLEEDTGTSKHPEGRVDVDYSLLDYNRAGVPLMELVTDPDIETAQEAKEFCQKYQLILRTLGVADADMEKGQMRCEANISLRELKTKNEKLKTKLGTKVEVKNLNSFKAVERAVEYEIERQAEVLEAGEKVVQETRGWDDKNGQTYTMRVKETSADYRYFPEPDLPPVEVTNKEKAEIRKQLPELPEEKSKRYKNMGFAEVIQETIPLNTEWAKAFDLGEPEKLTLNQRKIYGNFYVGIGLKLLNIGKIKADRINPKNIARLSVLIDENKISSNIAKEEKLFIEAITSDKDIAEIIKAKGLTQISDSGKLEAIIEKIIKDNPDAVAKIKSGQTGVMGFLVGQIMRETKGQANPKIVNEILRKKISLNK